MGLVVSTRNTCDTLDLKQLERSHRFDSIAVAVAREAMRAPFIHRQHTLVYCEDTDIIAWISLHSVKTSSRSSGA
jgi:hypothetical protein